MNTWDGLLVHKKDGPVITNIKRKAIEIADENFEKSEQEQIDLVLDRNDDFCESEIDSQRQSNGSDSPTSLRMHLQTQIIENLRL